MANKRFYQFLYSKHAKLTMINGLVTIGATGAVSSVTGAGVQGVTRLGTGLYRVKLVDNYAAFVGFSAYEYSPLTGSPVADGSLVTGTLYQITVVGTTNWVSAGFDPDFTPAVGGVFVATGAGGAGTGTATAVGLTGIDSVEVAQSQSSLLQNNNTALGRGSAVIMQTLSSAGALANPASGSQIGFKIWFRDSSVLSF